MRWTEANFQTLIEAKRTTLQCKSTKESCEVSYYISNAKIVAGKEQEIFNAIRGHWKVETNNYIRDVIFKEDALRTKESTITKVMASCRTIAVNLLNKLQVKNMKAKLDEFADNLDLLLNWMTPNEHSIRKPYAEAVC